MKTSIAYSNALDRNLIVHRDAPWDATRDYLEHRLCVLDDMPWDGLDIVRRGLQQKHREFKAPYVEGDLAPEVEAAYQAIVGQAKALFPLMFPTFKSVIERTSIRPMITGPEPMHFDSYEGDRPLVTAYINFADVPRHYRIGNNFPGLLKTHRKEMLDLVKDHKKDITYTLRTEAMKGRGPLGPDAPRHDVQLAPGAIWFFNAKTVSHEVVYGTGAIGISWEVPKSGAKLPAQLMKGMR